MGKHPVRKIITEAIWWKREVALAAAPHSAAARPAKWFRKRVTRDPVLYEMGEFVE